MADIHILGLDEIALRKGQRDYVTWVTGQLSNGELVILGVLPGHEQAPPVEFLRWIPQRILPGVQTVCGARWEAYPEALREEIPSARSVADRFQVAKPDRHAADPVRKQELRRLKKALPKEASPSLPGSFPAFRKNAKDLNKEERKILRRFFEYSASAEPAYVVREQLTAILDMNLSQKQAQAKILHGIQQVRQSGLDGFDDFLKWLATGGEEITNYFIQRQNPGFGEGCHNTVKVLKRRCYGIFRQRPPPPVPAYRA